MKELNRILTETARKLESSQHPRVNIAWQDRNMVFQRVYNPTPALGDTKIVGKKLESVLPDGKEAERLTALKHQVLETGQPYSATIELEIGGERHCFDLTIEPTYDEHGEVDGLVSVTVDITDLEQAKQRLAEANARLTKLLGETLKTEPVSAHRPRSD